MFRSIKHFNFILLFTCLAMVSSFGAHARNFYSVPFKAKLVYSNIEAKKKSVGSISGYLAVSDDLQKSWFRVENKEIPINFKDFKRTYKKNAFASRTGYDLAFSITSNEMRDLLELSTKNSRLKFRVLDLIKRYFTGTANPVTPKNPGPIKPLMQSYFKVAANYDFKASHKYKRTLIFVNIKSDRKNSFQFHDNMSGESLHLKVTFGRRVNVL